MNLIKKLAISIATFILILQMDGANSQSNEMVITFVGTSTGKPSLPMDFTIDSTTGIDNMLYATTTGSLDSIMGSISVTVDAANTRDWKVNATQHVIDADGDNVPEQTTLHAWDDGWGVNNGRIAATQILMLNFDTTNLILPSNIGLKIVNFKVKTQNDQPASPRYIVQGMTNTKLSSGTEFMVNTPISSLGSSEQGIAFTRGPYNLYSITIQTYIIPSPLNEMVVTFSGSRNGFISPLPSTITIDNVDEDNNGSDSDFMTTTGSFMSTTTGSISIDIEAASFNGWSVDATSNILTIDTMASAVHSWTDGWGVISGRIATTQLLVLNINIDNLILPENTGIRIAGFTVETKDDIPAKPLVIIDGMSSTKYTLGTHYDVDIPLIVGSNNRIAFTDGAYNLYSIILQAYEMTVTPPSTKMVLDFTAPSTGYFDLPMSFTIHNLDNDTNGSDNEFVSTTGALDSTTGSIDVMVEASSFGGWSIDDMSYDITIDRAANAIHARGDGWGVISGRIGSTQLLVLKFNLDNLVLPPDMSIRIASFVVSTGSATPATPRYIVDGQSDSMLSPSTEFLVNTPLSADLGVGFSGGPYSLLSLTLETYPTEVSASTPTTPPTDMPTFPPTPIPTTSTPTKMPVGEPEWRLVEYTGEFQARHEACFVMVGSKAYLLGGRGDRRVDIYDPSKQEWTAGSDPGIEINHFQCVAVDDAVYLPAVWTNKFPYETPVDAVMVYNTTTDTWYNKTGLPEWRQRGSTAAVLVGRDIYVSHGNKGGHGRHATTRGDLDVYHIDTDTWTVNLPKAPNPRDHAGGALMADGRICIAGGRDTGVRNFNDRVILPTDCYDPATNSWTVEADIPQGRAGSSYGTTCDGKLMVAGGEGFGQAWSNVDVFDGKTWTTIDSLNVAVHGSGLAVDCTCNQIHIASGSPNQGGGQTSTMETLFPGGINVPCPAPP